jgi:hypothetical protein
VFAERYPNKHRPSHDMVRRLLKNCSENGKFLPKHDKGKTSVDNEENEVNVLAFFTAYPQASIRDA